MADKKGVPIEIGPAYNTIMLGLSTLLFVISEQEKKMPEVILALELVDAIEKYERTVIEF